MQLNKDKQQLLAVCLLLAAAMTQAFMPATLSATTQGTWSEREGSAW
jgi:hypothetical protein